MTTIGKTIRHGLTAVLFSLALGVAGNTAHAGRGGSADLINAAVQSGSTDAIIAEVERAEGLMCDECIQTVTNLTEDSRYRVREVAAWWFAKRPQLADALAEQFRAELANGDSIKTRNAADFLGSLRDFKSLPMLEGAIRRGGLSSEAKLAIVRAVGLLAHVKGNPALLAAMSDGDPSVRAAAVVAWRDVLGQTSVEPVMGLLGDRDAEVRAKAATLAGAYASATARPQLETLVVSDPDATVRKNAAWALGKIGDPGSRAALTKASADPSALVHGVAKAALSTLRQ